MISEKKFFKAMASLEKAGYSSISHRLFDGMRHEVLNEKNSLTVYRDIAKTLFSWIDRIRSDEYIGEADPFSVPEDEQPAAAPEVQPEIPATEDISAEKVAEKQQAAAESRDKVMQLLESVAPSQKAEETAPEEVTAEE